MTAILLTCSYNDNQEFFRVGYYVNNAYDEKYPLLIESPPATPDISKLNRHILVEKPRVTKFQIDWEEEDAINDPSQNVGIAPQIPDDANNLEKQIGQEEGLMAKGTQGADRIDMMNPANLAQAAQNFN